jgi:ribosomal protein S12 methylthiotransferase accessory factor
MAMTITFPGGKKVDAHFRDFHIKTDQSVLSGGEASAAEPYMLFLASIGTCAGIYIVDFCQSRGIPFENIKLIQQHERNRETRRLEKITIEIHVPKDFPEKYHKALIRAADLCAVKKTIMDPPEIVPSVSVSD